MRRAPLEAERESQLAAVEVAELKPAAAREIELRRGLVPRRQTARLRENVFGHPAERVDLDDAVAGSARIAAEPGRPARDTGRAPRYRAISAPIPALVGTASGPRYDFAELC